MSHHAQFKALADWLHGALKAQERFTLSYNAEASDFIRFNHAKVRQAGHVQQASVAVKLIENGRHADLNLTLSGDEAVDRQRLSDALHQLRETLTLLPEDPYLLLNDEPWQSTSRQDTPLPDRARVVEHIAQLGEGLDLVGIYASGPIYRGFASSSGALGWHQANSFNLDFSLFHENGQAVKANYAGHQWSDDAFAKRFALAREQLTFLGQPSHTLPPGQYRAYLAPAALEEVMSMLCWGGFSAQSLADKTSPLQRLYDRQAALNPLVSLDERVTGSLSPAFSGEGYPRSDLSLIVEGVAKDRLINSRSAAEYGLMANGAGEGESPSALSMNGGSLALDDVLKALGTGLYISNLWYLNFSDRTAGRITGMTRFATFWVEDGKIKAPVSTMRFDDSLFNLLGDALEQLTTDRELLLSASTYSQRHTASNLLPGALVSRLTLTL